MKKNDTLKLYVVANMQGEYRKIAARLVNRVGDNSIENVECRSDYYNLEISCQASKGHEKPYGFGICFKEPYKVRLEDAKRMAKVLTKLESGLERIYVKRGAVKSFAEYLGRVSELLKCEFVFASIQPISSYDSGKYVFSNTLQAMNTISDMETKLIQF